MCVFVCLFVLHTHARERAMCVMHYPYLFSNLFFQYLYFQCSPRRAYLSCVASVPPFSCWPSCSFFPCRLSRVSLQTYQVKTSECNLPTRDPPAGGCLLPAQHTASRQLLLLETLLFKSRVAGAAVRLVRRSIAVKSSGCLLQTLTCECLSRSAAFLSVCAATQPNNSVIILMCRIPEAARHS